MENWIKLKDKKPNVVDHNEKVLLFRIMNDSQKSQEITIHETSMVKHCKIVTVTANKILIHLIKNQKRNEQNIYSRYFQEI